MDKKAKEDRVKQIISDLQYYMNTYTDQPYYYTYTDETIIKDVLYGLGIALDNDKYEFADGFKKFKAVLMQIYLQEEDE